MHWSKARRESDLYVHISYIFSMLKIILFKFDDFLKFIYFNIFKYLIL